MDFGLGLVVLTISEESFTYLELYNAEMLLLQTDWKPLCDCLPVTTLWLPFTIDDADARPHLKDLSQ